MRLDVYVSVVLLFAQNEIPGMNNSWDYAEASEKNVDEKIAGTSLV